MILFNDALFEAKQFPNGEIMIEKEWLGKNKKETGNKFTLKYQGNADLFHLLLLRKSVWFPIDLEITYMPYSRMDRTSDDYVFTLKALGKYLNWLDFNQIHLFEPHSDVTPAIINKCRIHSLLETLLLKTPFDLGRDAVLYPDAGAQKKYSGIIKSPNELIGFKQRDFKTGRIKELKIFGDCLVEGEELAGIDVYIIDDLCSKGGTFILAAERLKKMGAGNIYLVVAHCENTIFQGQIFKTDLIKKVYTTDTIPLNIDSNSEAKDRLEIHKIT